MRPCRILQLAEHRRRPREIGFTCVVLVAVAAAIAPFVICRHVAAQGPAPARAAGESPEQPTQQLSRLTISGECVAEDRKPIVNARIRFFLANRAEKSQRELPGVTTDATGSFSFAFEYIDRGPQQPRELLCVVAQAPGKATVISGVRVGSRGHAHYPFRLRTAGSLSGRITGEDGQPVAGATVFRATQMKAPVPGVLCAVTDADGRYQIADMSVWDAATQKPRVDAAGRTTAVISHCYLNVRHPEYAYEGVAYRKVPGVVDGVLHRPAHVGGRVLDEKSNSAAGAMLRFRDEHARDVKAVTDRAGRYALEPRRALRPGKYTLYATLEGRPTLVRPHVLIAEGNNTLDLQFEKGGVIEGRVVDVTTGKPPVLAERQTVTINRITSAGNYHSLHSGVQMRPDGTFAIHVPKGNNKLEPEIAQPWRNVNYERLRDKGIEVAEGQTVRVDVRVKSYSPEDDHPKPVSAERAAELHEQAAVAAVKALGGEVTFENVDGRQRVTGVNMAFRENEDEGRVENDLLTDEALAYVRKFPRLKVLSLKNTQVTDEGLANLRGNQSLEELHLWDASAMTDAGAAHVATLPNLKCLCLTKSKLTDEALRHFSKLPRIEYLLLQQNRFTDKGLAHLKDMVQLKDLSVGLGQTDITDDGMRHLAGLKNLESLDLQSTRVIDAGLKHLYGLTKLKELALPDATTHAGIAELKKKLPNVRTQDDEDLEPQ